MHTENKTRHALDECRANLDNLLTEARLAQKANREMSRLLRGVARRAKELGLAYKEFDAVTDWLNRVEKDNPL